MKEVVEGLGMAVQQIFMLVLLLVSTGGTSIETLQRVEEEGYYKREHSLVQPYHGKAL